MAYRTQRDDIQDLTTLINEAYAYRLRQRRDSTSKRLRKCLDDARGRSLRWHGGRMRLVSSQDGIEQSQ